MGWKIVKQPDGLFSVFSSVVDNFVITDATQAEVLAEFVHETTSRVLEQALKQIHKAEENAGEYEKYVETIKQVHGDPPLENKEQS